jgi:hypothetical protein
MHTCRAFCTGASLTPKLINPVPGSGPDELPEQPDIIIITPNVADKKFFNRGIFMEFLCWRSGDAGLAHFTIILRKDSTVA